MSDAIAGQALDLLQRTVLGNPWIPWTPTPRQARCLVAPEREVLYGGAAGGGKTVCALMGAAQYVGVPGYNAVIFRKTFAELNQADGPIVISKQWWLNSEARWNSDDRRWTFPSGATVSFWYLEHEDDKYKHQGAQYHYVNFEELTHFTRTSYTYLMSRLRRVVSLAVPIRMRATANPGGPGHEWVKARFIDAQTPDRAFIPARLEDNPYLDRAEYEATLAELDSVTRRHLLNGEWDVLPEGTLFKREWLTVVDGRTALPPMRRVVRYWDLAATRPAKGKDPDYAAGVKMGRGDNGRVYVMDVRHARLDPLDLENMVRRTAEADGPGVLVRIEEEPGSSGKIAVDHYARHVLPDFDCRGIRSQTDKVTRARPFSAACERGDVHVCNGPWVGGYLDELCAFPDVPHDDRVDASTGAYQAIVNDADPWDREDVRRIFDRKRTGAARPTARDLLAARRARAVR